MYTSMVEYSLLGAAIMFIVWRNVGQGEAYVKRKLQIRMDCSKTTSGLFCGLAFLAATFSAMAVFYGHTILGRNDEAALVFGLTEIAQVGAPGRPAPVQYLVAVLGCALALWQMRLLRYCAADRIGNNPNQVGISGFYCIIP